VPRAGLSPAVVVEEASTVADELGFESLTLAAVAQRLGVALPSLYKHVRGLGDLRRQMAIGALRELGDVVTRAAAGKARGDALRAFTGAYWDYAHQRPGRYAATVVAPDPSDPAAAAAARDVLAVVFAVLEGYGITGDGAVDATRMLRALVHGYVTLEAAGGFGMPRDVRGSFDRAIDAIDVSLTNWS
jgi:AcrR family transcriptional regulator